MNIARLRVPPGSRFRLASREPGDTCGVTKLQATRAAQRQIERLSALQDLLYAEHKRAILVVLQGMDASGKDGTIKHVMSGVNPQGCQVTSFKEPSHLELDHDFLWRIHAAVPRKGQIGIFNRSHYEDVLIARVHSLVPKSVWSSRYRQINRFEEILAENGVHILKFFLHISSEEQEKRFNDRLSDPAKNWKSSPADFSERKHWDQYQAAYQDALVKCSTENAPWHVIPADRKWFRNYAIAEVIAATLESFKMQYPRPAPAVAR